MQALANVATSHDAVPSSVPMRGRLEWQESAWWTGCGNAAPANSPVAGCFRTEVSQKIAAWSAERASGLSHKPAGTSRKVPLFRAVSALRSLM